MGKDEEERLKKMRDSNEKIKALRNEQNEIEQRFFNEYIENNEDIEIDAEDNTQLVDPLEIDDMTEQRHSDDGVYRHKRHSSKSDEEMTEQKKGKTTRWRARNTPFMIWRTMRYQKNN